MNIELKEMTEVVFFQTFGCFICERIPQSILNSCIALFIFSCYHDTPLSLPHYLRIMDTKFEGTLECIERGSSKIYKDTKIIVSELSRMILIPLIPLGKLLEIYTLRVISLIPLDNGLCPTSAPVLLDFCEGNPPMTCGFPSKKPTTQKACPCHDATMALASHRVSKTWPWWRPVRCFLLLRFV